MLSTLPVDFGNLINLKNISLSNCEQLSMLPESFNLLIHLENLYLSFCEMLSTLPVDFGNLINLKNIDMSYCTQLSTLPASFKQLIHLENLNLCCCAKLQLKLDMLENIRKLKFLNLEGCKELEDLPHHIVNQASLTELLLRGCVKLRGLPTGTGELVSLKSLTIADCPKVEKIEGLQHSKSLKHLWLKTAWKVPGIQSLENLERLESLVLTCDTISAVKPCIQSLKECPSNILIRGSVSRFAKQIVNSLDLPDLTVKELQRPFNEGLIVSLFDAMTPFFCYMEGKKKNKDRKVVRIGVSLKNKWQILDIPHFRRQGQPYLNPFPELSDERVLFFHEVCAGVTNEKAILVWGGVERVVEAFNKLLALLE